MGGIEDYVDIKTQRQHVGLKSTNQAIASLKNDFVELQKATKGGVIKIKSLGKSLKPNWNLVVMLQRKR